MAKRVSHSPYAGFQNGALLDPLRCSAEIEYRDRSANHQCNRRASRAGWCWQHDPESGRPCAQPRGVRVTSRVSLLVFGLEVRLVSEEVSEEHVAEVERYLDMALKLVERAAEKDSPYLKIPDFAQ